jgi:hypothetical protein
MALVEQALGKPLGKKARPLRSIRARSRPDMTTRKPISRSRFRSASTDERDGRKILIEGNAARYRLHDGRRHRRRLVPITPSSSLCESLITYSEVRVDKDRKRRSRLFRPKTDRSARHGHRRGLGGARSMASTTSPGIYSDGRVRRPLVHAGSRRSFRRAACGTILGLPTRTRRAIWYGAFLSPWRLDT